MKICSRCNNEVKKHDLVCTRCGFSLIKDQYGRRIYINNRNIKNPKIKTKKINNVNDKSKSVILSIVIIVVSCLFSFLGIVFEYENDFESDGSNKDYSFIYDYTYSVKLITEDYYEVWTLGEFFDDITLNDIEASTSLYVDDMISDECILSKENGNISNALSCVIDTHIYIGTYEDAYNELSNLYDYIEENSTDANRNVLIEIYNTLYQLYYLPDLYTEYEVYEEQYFSLRTELSNLITSLSK